MTADPIAEENIRHAHFKRFAVAAELKLNPIAEPKAKSRLTQPLRHRCTQGR
jgi:hypothetical protein